MKEFKVRKSGRIMIFSRQIITE